MSRRRPCILANAIAGLLLAACASHPPPPVVAEAVGVASVSGLSVSCNRPVELTRDCSGLSGADRSINLAGSEVRVAGSADGRQVLVMPPEITGSDRGGPGLVTHQTNLRVERVKTALAVHQIRVVKATPIVSSGAVYGYVLELDGDGYTRLAAEAPVAEALPTVAADDVARLTNVRDSDGTVGFLHFQASDMPIVVALPPPTRSPPDGSPGDALETMAEAVAAWQEALASRVPWLEFEIVDQHPDPDIEIRWLFDRWSRKNYRRAVDDDPVGPNPKVVLPMGAPDSVLFDLDWIYESTLHAVGFALGLRAEPDEDSAMNLQWVESQPAGQRAIPTALDVERFCALQAQPTGFRVDGIPLQRLLKAGWQPPPVAELASPCH